MCGLAGILYREPGRAGPTGRLLTDLLGVLGSRGTDGTGVALYGTPQDGARVLRVYLGEAASPAVEAGVIARIREVDGTAVAAAGRQGDVLRLVLHGVAPVEALARAAERGAPGVSVFSAGEALEVVKDAGDAARLDALYAVSEASGSHGIGHTRLATESRVDVRHSHPFWARPFPDLAIVHNGQITNYHRLRRRYEAQGWHFGTDNDSEIIALFLGHEMASGATLEEAMRASMSALDGTFTYLVATADGIGFARDAFATKPLIVAETDGCVAFASEERALCRAFGDGPLETRQPAEKEVRVWRR